MVNSIDNNIFAIPVIYSNKPVLILKSISISKPMPILIPIPIRYLIETGEDHIPMRHDSHTPPTRLQHVQLTGQAKDMGPRQEAQGHVMGVHVHDVLGLGWVSGDLLLVDLS